jgi:hypothetical protein
VTPDRVSRRAGLLMYAAMQFVVLTAIAMWIYPGGTLRTPSTTAYSFTGNFFSDLGATRTWSGAPNHTGSILFGIALGTLGVAFIAFAGTWRGWAFEHGRTRAAGLAAHGFGTTSGAAFAGVAFVPVNRALVLHNSLVVAAFALLLGYAAATTIVWWRNGATRGQRAVSLGYLVFVAAYLVVVLVAVRTGVTTMRGVQILVISQKLIVYGSMIYVVYLTIAVRRQPARA